MTTTSYLELEDQANGANNNTWGDVLDQNMAYVELAIARYLSISTTGGTTTLTSSQNRYPTIVLTGTLVSNATIEVKAQEKNWHVINNTSGSFTVTVKTPSGTGYIVPRRRSLKLYCDGTNVNLVRNMSIPQVTAGGTADVMTGTVAPAIVSADLTDDFVVLVDAVGANTVTTPTINLNGLGAKTITKGNGAALVAGDIAGSSHRILLNYRATAGVFQLLNPATGTAATKDIGTSGGTVPLLNGTNSFSSTQTFVNIVTTGTAVLGDTVTIQSDNNGVTGTPQNRIAFQDLDTTVAANQTLGEIRWLTSDATAPQPVAARLNVSAVGAANGGGYMSFFTGDGSVTPPEQLRLDENGTLRLGATTATAQSTTPDMLGASSASSATGAVAIELQANTAAAQRWLMAFSTPSAVGGSISINGGTTNFNTSSDYRLKQDIEDMEGALDRLTALRPVRFRFKDQPESELIDGFIAHEAQAVVPVAVTGVKDGFDFQQMDHAKLVPLLVGAVQELTRQVAELRAGIR